MIVSSGATHQPELAHLAWDREPGTRWTSGTPMLPTMAYWVVLDAPAMISGISATTPEPNDNPADWTVFVMDSDGGHGLKEVAKGHGPIVATWPPVAGQWVKIVCDSASDEWWFSITDLVIDATDIPSVVEPPPVEPPVVDEEVGPAVFSETLARFWVERWARKFGWYLAQRDVISFTGELVAWEQGVVYLRARARPGGIMEPWPFT